MTDAADLLADKTLADLAKQALIELRVLRADGTPTAEQQDQVLRKYAAYYKQLQILDVAYWSIDAIPIEVFDPLAMLVAQQAQQSFGKQYSAGDALRLIYVAAGKPWSGKTVRAKYY